MEAKLTPEKALELRKEALEAWDNSPDKPSLDVGQFLWENSREIFVTQYLFAAGFKAGYDEAVKNAIISAAQAISQAILEGRKIGIGEVVEWLERVKKIKVPKYQLKEWGLLEPPSQPLQ